MASRGGGAPGFRFAPPPNHKSRLKHNVCCRSESPPLAASLPALPAARCWWPAAWSGTRCLHIASMPIAARSRLPAVTLQRPLKPAALAGTAQAGPYAGAVAKCMAKREGRLVRAAAPLCRCRTSMIRDHLFWKSPEYCRRAGAPDTLAKLPAELIGCEAGPNDGAFSASRRLRT